MKYSINQKFQYFFFNNYLNLEFLVKLNLAVAHINFDFAKLKIQFLFMRI